ncbi:MAG: putative bifunctional diguanylate cyclase/phosphodiesterase [Bacillota bacterium]
MPYFIVASSAGIGILLSGPCRLIYIMCLIAVTGVLIFLEFKYPQLVRIYSTSKERYVIVFAGLLITIISNAVLSVVILNNYKKEHKKSKEHLFHLEKANEKLQREITERRQIEESLRESEDKYRTMFQTSSTALCIIEENSTISLVNKEFAGLCGYSKDEIEGILSWKHFIPPENVERIIEYYYRSRNSHGDTRRNFETHFVDRDGNKKDMLLSVSMIPGTNRILASVVDISIIKQAEAQLKYLATHDHLTGIPNRYSFEESLKKAVTKARLGKESALLFIDIDNFKMINDTKGHTAGDSLLISVADTIRENLSQSDTLARLGGDEFGVLLEEITSDKARLIAEKLRQTIEEKDFCLSDYGCFNVSISVGVVMVDSTLNSQELLSHADTALYAAKENGRNRVALLDPKEETASRLAEINRLITIIKNAVREDNFVLHYQPVVCLDNARVVHHEVLVRLKREDGGLIPPQSFIPIAEQYGLMPLIDRWVVESSLETLKQHPHLNLLVNISGISLSDEHLLEYMEEIITTAGLEPLRIGFEITETSAVKDIPLAVRWIERLKKLGCQFALDDFGVGFSSFAYLRMLPVDYLKIDGSFIRNIDKDPSQRALVEAMRNIARSLGKKTIAEYVENEKVLKILKGLKIDYAQGYFLGKPAPFVN